MSAKSRNHPSLTESAEPSGGRERRQPPPRREEAPLPAGLYLVATPIGNLGDISRRALDVLRRADRIACEDSRITRKLLSAEGIGTPTTAYHDHSGARERQRLLDAVAGGAAVALVSDAGTPLVSDPGFKLVREAVAAGLPVTALPGPSAPLVALLLSGLPSDRFFFGGFLPAKSGARRKMLDELRGLTASLIFFEGPQRLAASLADMAAVLGPRPAAVARELTKLHEEVRRGSLAELTAHYAKAGAPRGEIVVVVGPADAAAAASGLPRRRVYARALELAEGGTGKS